MIALSLQIAFEHLVNTSIGVISPTSKADGTSSDATYFTHPPDDTIVNLYDPKSIFAKLPIKLCVQHRSHESIHDLL